MLLHLTGKYYPFILFLMELETSYSTWEAKLIYSLTPVSTIVAAYNQFLDDDSLTGQALECAADKTLFARWPEYESGHVTKRAATVWDPLFVMMHHDKSGLADAIP
jgi:hypothetical protein